MDQGIYWLNKTNKASQRNVMEVGIIPFSLIRSDIDDEGERKMMQK